MHKIINVPYINQTEQWPTGCESVSTVMLLQYLGINISVDEFISYLPQKDFTTKNGVTIGGNPHHHFIGSPYDIDAFGCYAPVIVNTLNSYFQKNNLCYKAVDVSEFSTDDLLEKYVAKNLPVIYWATIDLKESIIGPSWCLSENSSDIFVWKSNEHCMLLVGYDDASLYFNDPWDNHGMIAYNRALTEKRHVEMYSMAVVVLSSHALL